MKRFWAPKVQALGVFRYVYVVSRENIRLNWAGHGRGGDKFCWGCGVVAGGQCFHV